MSKINESVFPASFLHPIKFLRDKIESHGGGVGQREGASDHAENNRTEGGFSLVELLIAMSITLVLLGVVTIAFSGALRTRERESARTDALTAAQAAINVMSREISNAGYGLKNNGIVLADSNEEKLHIRSNITNTNLTTTDVDEDITYYHDTASKSVMRYDASPASTSALINQVSEVSFLYSSADTPTEETPSEKKHAS